MPADAPADVVPRLRRFEERIAQELHSDVAFIEAIASELVGAGGKRLRPTLAFLAGDILGADEEAVMTVALAVELLHSASLLHDDLIDDATTRRGAAAAFRRYGNVVSVMSGDFMLARVLGLLARSETAAFTKLMSETAVAICEGEVLQFQMATLETWSADTYRTIIEGKTAALFAAALEGVAIVAGAPAEARSALREFGLAYGRAFQMRDDYLDLLGDAETLGKPLGGDVREGKATLPVLSLIDDGITECVAILRRHAADAGDVPRMVALVREFGGDARTRAAIHADVGLALESLTAFRRTPARTALANLAVAESERVT
ncbi:MAG: polyprenyl synthetase family protein [Trueperaceae bacterium]|nr:polyprenyl synthetase family protein [Trueperaceae bacterium]